MRIPFAGAEGVLPTREDHLPAAQRVCQHDAGHRDAQPAGDGDRGRLVVGRAGGQDRHRRLHAAVRPGIVCRRPAILFDRRRRGRGAGLHFDSVGCQHVDHSGVVNVSASGLVEGALACYLFLAVYALLLAGSVRGTGCQPVLRAALPWRAILPARRWRRSIPPCCSCCSRWPPGPFSDDLGQTQAVRVRGSGVRIGSSPRFGTQTLGPPNPEADLVGHRCPDGIPAGGGGGLRTVVRQELGAERQSHLSAALRSLRRQDVERGQGSTMEPRPPPGRLLRRNPRQGLGTRGSDEPSGSVRWSCRWRCWRLSGGANRRSGFVYTSRRLAWGLLRLRGFVVAVWWLFTHRIDRFWIPVLPVLALLAGAGACWSSAALVANAPQRAAAGRPGGKLPGGLGGPGQRLVRSTRSNSATIRGWIQPLAPLFQRRRRHGWRCWPSATRPSST